MYISIYKSADPLPPVPTSCRGDRRGMQLEAIGINGSPWEARPKAQKVDSQTADRSSPGTVLRSQDRSRTSPRTGPGPVLKLLPGPVLGARFGPRSRPGPLSGLVQAGPRIESWCARWYRIPLQTAAETRRHLEQLQTPVREGQFQGDPGQATAPGPTRSGLGASRPKRQLTD